MILNWSWGFRLLREVLMELELFSEPIFFTLNQAQDILTVLYEREYS